MYVSVFQERRSPFGDLPSSRSPPHVGEDRNLDDQIARDPKALERYLQTGPPNQHQGPPHYDSRHSHSESVVRKQFADGVSPCSFSLSSAHLTWCGEEGEYDE